MIRRSMRGVIRESCHTGRIGQYWWYDRRDDKRYTEKKNKSERARRKKEDNVRLRELVDNVLANDPRIKRIKAEEKAARDSKKKGGVVNGTKPMTGAEKKKADEAKKAEEASKKEEEKKVVEMSKADREAAKKAKEAARKNLKKWKKVRDAPGPHHFDWRRDSPLRLLSLARTTLSQPVLLRPRVSSRNS